MPKFTIPKQSRQLISKTPIKRRSKESCTFTSTLILNGMRTGESGIEVEIGRSGQSSRDFTGKGHRGPTLCAAVYSLFRFFWPRSATDLQCIVRGSFLCSCYFTVLPRYARCGLKFQGGKIKKKLVQIRSRHVCLNFDLFAYISHSNL